MPSEDKYHEQRPETNSWLERDESGAFRLTAPTRPGSFHASARANDASRTRNAAKVQALAAKLGLDAEKLAQRIPEDTLRRLKFPMLEQTDPLTGLTSFKHDVGIVEGRKGLTAVDRAHESIPHGSGGKGHNAPTPRDDAGRFTK